FLPLFLKQKHGQTLQLLFQLFLDQNFVSNFERLFWRTPCIFVVNLCRQSKEEGTCLRLFILIMIVVNVYKLIIVSTGYKLGSLDFILRIIFWYLKSFLSHSLCLLA